MEKNELFKNAKPGDKFVIGTGDIVEYVARKEKIITYGNNDPTPDCVCEWHVVRRKKRDNTYDEYNVKSNGILNEIIDPRGIRAKSISYGVLYPYMEKYNEDALTQLADAYFTADKTQGLSKKEINAYKKIWKQGYRYCISAFMYGNIKSFKEIDIESEGAFCLFGYKGMFYVPFYTAEKKSKLYVWEEGWKSARKDLLKK